MIVILLGAPGAGKGTQSRLLCEKYGFTHLATGDIFRSEIAAASELGQKAADYVKSGRLVPDSLVTEMVAGRLNINGTKYLLDGFPRNLQQAQDLDKFLACRKASVTAVIFLNLAHSEAIKRLTSRRVCSKCAEVYNVLTRPPKISGQCDACSGEVVLRDDDSESTAKKRLMVFEELTEPLVAYYKAVRVLAEVDAARGLGEVSSDLSAVIDSMAAAF